MRLNTRFGDDVSATPKAEYNIEFMLTIMEERIVFSAQYSENHPLIAEAGLSQKCVYLRRFLKRVWRGQALRIIQNQV